MENKKRFKYQTDIDIAISDGCPMPELHTPEGMQAYRFCFSYPHPNDYLPVLKINPRRRLDRSVRTTGYALSCFENKDKAKLRYSNLAKTFKAISTTLGDSISGGTIENEDGMVDDAEKVSSHFNLFEYESCNLSQTFKILEAL